jgi:uncharacterized protein YjbJ (UPF0337 family)
MQLLFAVTATFSLARSKTNTGSRASKPRSGSGSGRSSSVDGTEIKPRRSGLDPINHRRAADGAKMPQAAKGLSDAEGGSHALYNCFSIGSSVAAGIGDRIHSGILYSHPVGRCCRHGAAQPHSGEEINLVQLHIKKLVFARQPLENSPPTVTARKERGSAVPVISLLTGMRAAGITSVTPNSDRRKTMKSGIRDKAEGEWHQVKGKVKEIAGEISDDPDMEAEGTNEKIAGKVQEKIGQVKKVVGK